MVVKHPLRIQSEKRRLRGEDIDPSILARLRNVDWCARFLKDTSFIPIATEAREPKASTEDSLLADTLNTQTTIHTWQYFYRQTEAAEDPNAPWAELALVVGCGSGLNGHPSIMHGGMFSFILDEAVTMLAALHRAEGQSGMTASLKVDYKKPVVTPCFLLAKAFLLPSAGRKGRLTGALEDGNGTIFATAEALVIEIPSNHIKL